MNITGKWIGAISGTNEGHVFIDIEQQEQSIKSDVRFEDLNLGYLRMNAEGTLLESQLALELSDFMGSVERIPTTGQMIGTVSADGLSIEGRWQTDIGTNGEFRVRKHILTEELPPKALLSFHGKTVRLGSYRLSSRNLAGLLIESCSGTGVLVPVFQYELEGVTRTKLGVEEFFDDQSNPDILDNLKVSISERALGIGYREVIISFPKGWGEEPTLTVFGEDGTWVEGKVARLLAFLRNYESRARTFYRRFGPATNSIIFLTMLVMLPSIKSIFHRTVFVTIVSISLLGLLWLHRSLVSGIKVFLGKETLSFWERHKEGILGNVISAIVWGSILALYKWIPSLFGIGS